VTAPAVEHGSSFAFALFLRRCLLWLAPVVAIWWLATPLYNRVLTSSTEVLVRLLEAPNPVTRLVPRRPHHFLVQRLDVRRPDGAPLGSVRVTDVHFPVVLTAVLFLAVPAPPDANGQSTGRSQRRSQRRAAANSRTGHQLSPWRRRLLFLGWALLVSFLFHLVSLVFWVEFVYATQLGQWSMEHYGAFARNFWGLGKHLLDLPFKLALPLILWCGFYFDLLTGESGVADDRTGA